MDSFIPLKPVILTGSELSTAVMPKNHLIRTYFVAIAGFLLAFFLSMRVFNDGVPGWKHIVTSDGRGYYAYLPALLLDHDPSFARVTEREAKMLGIPHYKPSYLGKAGERTVNKYFAGEALLLLPFFLAGWLFSWIFGSGIDGYSFFFQFFTGIGSLFYLLIGVYYLFRLLDCFEVKPVVAVIAVSAALFGTNLFYYALWQPTMSHIFSFAAVNGVLWFSARFFRERRMASAVWAGIMLGIVCLIRPTNAIIILLIPAMAGGLPVLQETLIFLRKEKGKILLPALIMVTLVSIQPVLWYIQTGKPFLWSYRDEGFHLFNPEIANVLFSFRKGLFIYTPLAILAIPALVPLFFRNRMQFYSILFFLVISTWIIASWWNWYYGDSFGLRAFIDYYGILCFLLAILIGKITRKAALVPVSLILFLFVTVNLIQTWQYTHRVIQPNSMNREKYRYVFLRTDSAVINCLGGNAEMASFATDTDRPLKTFFNDFEKEHEGWSNMAVAEISKAWSGRFAGQIDSLHQYSSGLMIRAGDLGKLPGDFFVEGEVMVRDIDPGAGNNTLVALSMDSIRPGENWWQGFRINDIPLKTGNTWRKVRFSLMTPVISNPGGMLKIYLWNTGKKRLILDDFSIRIYGKKQSIAVN